jgi:hypothetical protein
MKTTYASADVVNDLLEGIHVEGRFTEGKVSGDVLDLMDSKNAGTQVFSGKPPDIWLPAGNLKPEMKSGTFAYFHGLSVEPGTTGWLVRGDSTTFTSPKNTKYSPVVQPEGSLPVAIGVNGLGCGRVYLYGDPSAWQKESYIGKVYSETKYHEQEAARVLVSRMLSFNRTCEPCEQQAAAQATQPVPTVTTTRPRTIMTPSESGDCTSCIEECKSTVTGSTESDAIKMIKCINQCPGVDLSGFSTAQGVKICRSCAHENFPSGSNPNPSDPLGGYATCIEQNGCSCPSSSGTCDTCIQQCNDNYQGTDENSMSNRMNCLNDCYLGGSVLGLLLKNEGRCQYCWNQASATGATGSAAIDAYSQCLMDQDCTCPSLPRTGDCNTCIDDCNNQGLSGNALKTCFSGCGEGLCGIAWTTCNDPANSNVKASGNFQWKTSDSVSTEMATVKKGTEGGTSSSATSVMTPGTCYALAMEASDCTCKDLTFCANKCPVGQTEVFGADGTSWCVTGTLDAAACNQQCPSPASGSLDSCGVCRCMETFVSEACSQDDCPEGTTAGMVDGVCMCTRSVLSECTSANCVAGMTASLDANGNCICTGSMLANPGGTTTQPSCLDCYKNCTQGSSTGTSSTGTNKFSKLSGAKVLNGVKETEMVFNTCQKTCDSMFKTTIVSCACANTQCGEDETPFPQADLSCTCMPKTQIGALPTGIDLSSLSSMWNAHYEGTPVSTGTGSTQKPIGGIIPIPR